MVAPFFCLSVVNALLQRSLLSGLIRSGLLKPFTSAAFFVSYMLVM